MKEKRNNYEETLCGKCHFCRHGGGVLPLPGTVAGYMGLCRAED